MDKERYFVWKNYDALETLVESPPTTATIVEKSITTNGTYRASSDSADGYNPVVVNVANSYSAGDEGKVVDNGALVSQTAYPTTVTVNDTYDTTLNNSITVNVANSYTAGDEGKVVDNGELVSQTAYPSTVTTNGTITTTTNNSVTINVANSYTAGDEGKVVDNGALVSQTSTTITTNNTTVDTTLINSVSVAVPSSTFPYPAIGLYTTATSTNAARYAMLSISKQPRSDSQHKIYVAISFTTGVGLSSNLSKYPIGYNLSDYFDNDVTITLTGVRRGLNTNINTTATINLTTNTVNFTSFVFPTSGSGDLYFYGYTTLDAKIYD